MTKINWELERVKSFLQSKNYKQTKELGSINYTCYVYESSSNGKRIEVWDDKSGELVVVDMNNRSIDLEKL